jgi:protein-serine/threonine kinase
MNQALHHPPQLPKSPSPVNGSLIAPQQSTLTTPIQSSSRSKGADYVYFERDTSGFSTDAVARSTAAKLKLESYYKVAVDAAIERNARRLELEMRLTQIPTQDGKDREIRKYTRTESQHLRLKRTRIKLADFMTVKVIGKGAFGEVRVCATIYVLLIKSVCIPRFG